MVLARDRSSEQELSFPMQLLASFAVKVDKHNLTP